MSQNSANSSPGNNSKNIPKVVNDHADRLMDGLFADIEELLSGDLSKQQKSQPATIGTASPVGAMGQVDRQSSEQNMVPAYQYKVAPATTPPAEAAPVPPVKGGLWPKILIGLGLTALAVGGGVWWLAKENKINLALLAPSDVSKADLQFADYLRRAFGKIDSTSTPTTTQSQVTIPNPPGVVTAPTGNIPLSPSVGAVPAAPLAIGKPLVPTTVPAVPLVAANSSFVKVVNSNPPTAEFVIDGKAKQLSAGDKIGDSGWSLTTVISALDNEVIIKRNGELRTLKAGQKF
jgi:hypothetical protein